MTTNRCAAKQAIVDGEPPDLPASGYSDQARDFVRQCLNKVPKHRPTYAMLLRHPWLAELLKPPTITEDAEAEASAEAGAATPPGPGSVEDAIGNMSLAEGVVDTADKEVADWVKAALERKRLGKMKGAKKPALHAAPLDAVPGSPEGKREIGGADSGGG